jgi:hypothetical protein
MKIFNFKKFIGQVNEDLVSDISSKISETNKDIKEDLIKMVQKTINSEDQNDFMEKLDSVIRNPKELSIEGLMQDADVYEFYLKYRNELDEILSKSGFFEKLQEFQKENNSIGLYDFIVKGTLEAVKVLVEEIKSDISNEEPAQ